MGERVCWDAFLKLSGIGVSSVVKARNGALADQQSSLSLKELSICLRITNTNKDQLFLDARQWLEMYADTHGENSPMECLSYLPAGRKQFYYAH